MSQVLEMPRSIAVVCEARMRGRLWWNSSEKFSPCISPWYQLMTVMSPSKAAVRTASLSARLLPLTSITLSGPLPPVSSRTAAATSCTFVVSNTWSAPFSAAILQREASASTPITCIAPFILASCATIWPSAPRPNTTTVSPSLMRVSKMPLNAVTRLVQNTPYSGFNPAGSRLQPASCMTTIDWCGADVCTMSPTFRPRTLGPVSTISPTLLYPIYHTPGSLLRMGYFHS